jgi:hypothetical protein
MAKRLYRRSNREEPQDRPEMDLVEEPTDQRDGEEPEDLLRRSDAEQAERDRELRRRA